MSDFNAEENSIDLTEDDQNLLLDLEKYNDVETGRDE